MEQQSHPVTNNKTLVIAGKMVAAICVIGGIIGLVNVISFANTIGEYKNNGIAIKGIVERKEETLTQASISKRTPNYKKNQYVMVETTIANGVKQVVRLHESEPVYDSLKVGDTIDMLYLKKNTTINSYDNSTSFLYSNDPVPASIVNRNPFSEIIFFMGIGFLTAGIVAWILLSRKKSPTQVVE